MMANHSKIVSDIACFTAHFTRIVGAMNFLPLCQRPITFSLGMGKASTDLAKGNHCHSSGLNHCNGRSIPLGNDMIITYFWTIFLVFIKPPQRGCCGLFDAFHDQCCTSVGILAIVTKIKAGGTRKFAQRMGVEKLLPKTIDGFFHTLYVWRKPTSRIGKCITTDQHAIAIVFTPKFATTLRALIGMKTAFLQAFGPVGHKCTLGRACYRVF